MQAVCPRNAGLRMTAAQQGLLVAAHGWSHAAWCGSFYPDDLPEDWWLSFYSNEFRAVVVPAAEWTAVDTLVVERWVEDTHGEFRFYLEVAELMPDWDGFAARAGILGAQLGGILLCPPELDIDLAFIASDLEAAVALAPVSLSLPGPMELSREGKDLLRRHAVELRWDVATVIEPPPRCGSGLAVARVASTMAYAPRQWREIIEACLRPGVADTALVVIEGEAPEIESLRAATMIGDMLVSAME